MRPKAAAKDARKPGSSCSKGVPDCPAMAASGGHWACTTPKKESRRGFPGGSLASTVVSGGWGYDRRAPIDIGMGGIVCCGRLPAARSQGLARGPFYIYKMGNMLPRRCPIPDFGGAGGNQPQRPASPEKYPLIQGFAGQRGPERRNRHGNILLIAA